MARLPRFLNMSAARRVRLALPTARLAVIAFSFTLAAVGMGAFVATLPPSSATDGSPTATTESSADAQKAQQQSDQSSQEEPAQDAEAPAEGDPAAPEGDAAASGSYSAPGGTLSRPVTSAASGSSSSAAAPAESGSSSSGGTSASSGPDYGSGAGSSSGASSSPGSNSADSGTVDQSDPFNATPTAAEEAEFHNFLVGWYNKLADAEAAATNRDPSAASAGFNAVSSRVRSNYSKWCGAQEGLIGAYRSLFDYASTGDPSYYSEYQYWKSQVSL